jgi:hypothetical protein
MTVTDHEDHEGHEGDGTKKNQTGGAGEVLFFFVRSSSCVFASLVVRDPRLSWSVTTDPG